MLKKCCKKYTSTFNLTSQTKHPTAYKKYHGLIFKNKTIFLIVNFINKTNGNKKIKK